MSALASHVASTVRTGQRPFSIALTGGRTVVPVYETLGRQYPPAFWSDVDFCWSDERMVGRQHPESNYRSAWNAWLGPACVPPERVHHPNVNLTDVHEVARSYEHHLRALLGSTLALDCLLLSLGEDGHIGSVFPNHREALEDTRLVVGIEDSPRPPRRRVTFTLPLMARARRIHVLAAGAEKARALALTLARQWRQGEHGFPPAAGLFAAPGRVEWWVDRAAASLLPRPLPSGLRVDDWS